MDIDISALNFSLRNGIGWEVEPYRKLIEALCCDKYWADRDLEDLSDAEIALLAKIAYPKWSEGRNKYHHSLAVFFLNYKDQVEDDCNLFKHDCEVIPPELNSFRTFIGTMIKVMMGDNFKDKTDRFMKSEDREVELEFRKDIAMSIVDHKDNKNEYQRIFRKVSRKFKDHYQELKNALQVIKNDDIRVVTNVSASRRSARLVILANEKSELEIIENKIRLRDESDFKKVMMGEIKGYGVTAMRPFEAGDFLLEYAGELMSKKDGIKKHELYSHNANIGSFIFDFKFQDKHYSIDATTCETNRLGRFVNHSMRVFNAKVKIRVVCNRPRLLLFATKHIEVGDELLYDYGDRDEESIKNHPWLLT